MTDQIQVPDVLARFKSDNDAESVELADDATAISATIAALQAQLQAAQLLAQKIADQQAVNQKFADLIATLTPPAPVAAG